MSSKDFFIDMPGQGILDAISWVAVELFMLYVGIWLAIYNSYEPADRWKFVVATFGIPLVVFLF